MYGLTHVLQFACGSNDVLQKKKKKTRLLKTHVKMHPVLFGLKCRM